MYPEIGNRLIGLIDRVGQASCLLIRPFTGWKPVLLLLFASSLSNAADSSIDYKPELANQFDKDLPDSVRQG